MENEEKKITFNSQSDILFNRLGIYYYELSTKTGIREDHTVCTIYYVEWHCKYGTMHNILQEIGKEEYEFLMQELEKETSKKRK